MTKANRWAWIISLVVVTGASLVLTFLLSITTNNRSFYERHYEWLFWLNIVVAVLLDGLLFGASHAELAQLPGLVAVGVVLSLCYVWTGRLGLSILTHVGFNSVAIAAYTSGVVLWLH